MWNPGRVTHPKPILALGALACAVVALALPATAAAAGTWGCESSAVRGTVLGTGTIEPVTARNGANDCVAQQSGLVTPLPSPLTANAVFAVTAADRNVPVERRAVSATGGIGEIGVKVLPQLNIPLPAPNLSGVPDSVPLPSNPLLTVSGIQAALAQIIPAGVIPNTDLVKLEVGRSTARASCVGGRASLEGTSRVLGLTLLGKELPTDRAIDQAITLDSASIDPSTLDPAAFAGAIGGLVVTSEIAQQVLDALPTIPVPPSLGRLRVTPDQQIRTANSLTQRALQVQLELGGRSIVDLVLGEAIVRNNAVTCGPQSAAQAALQCTTRRLVLADVIPGRRRVRLLGYADRKLIGKRVTIRFTATGKRVARPRVRRNGTFRATAPMPNRRIRGTNRARYIAVHRKEKSLRLKLMRRMLVRSVRVSGNKVRIRGRVTRPLSKPLRRIVLKRRVSCGKTVVVRRFKPRRNGRFAVTVSAPPRQQAAVYRFETRVRKNTTNPKLFPTFTLPRYVDLS